MTTVIAERVRVLQPVAGAAFNFAANTIIELPRGQRWPRALVAFFDGERMVRLGPDEEISPTAPRVLMDAAKFDAGIATAARHAQPVPRPVEMSAEDVKARFGWTDEQLETAFTLAFPKAQLRSQRGGRYARIWGEREVDEWAARIRALRVTQS